MENDHRNSGFSQLENGGSFHSYVNVYQRVIADLLQKPDTENDINQHDFWRMFDTLSLWVLYIWYNYSV